MAPYDVFFFSSLFFLVGVGLESLELSFWILVLTAVCAAVFIFSGFWKKSRRFFWIAGLSVLVLAGAIVLTSALLTFGDYFVESVSSLGGKEAHATVDDRLMSYEQAWKLLVKEPVFGGALSWSFSTICGSICCLKAGFLRWPPLLAFYGWRTEPEAGQGRNRCIRQNQRW